MYEYVIILHVLRGLKICRKCCCIYSFETSGTESTPQICHVLVTMNVSVVAFEGDQFLSNQWLAWTIDQKCSEQSCGLPSAGFDTSRYIPQLHIPVIAINVPTLQFFLWVGCQPPASQYMKAGWANCSRTLIHIWMASFLTEHQRSYQKSRRKRKAPGLLVFKE